MEKIEYNLEYEYINEDKDLVVLLRKQIQLYNSILLVSPQGTGKTSFLENLGQNCKLISPSRALANQVTNNSSYSYDDWGRYECVANTYIWGLETLKNAPNTEIVVFDEIHKLVQYESFAHEQMIAFNNIYNYCNEKDIKMIFCTATPQLLYCLKGQKVYDELNCFIEICADRRFVDTIYTYDKINESQITDLFERNHKDGELQVALINNSKLMGSITKSLKDKGYRVKGITSANKENIENKKISLAISRNEELTLDVLLVTSWIDVGVNIVNKNIKHIYYFVDYYYDRGDMTTLQQFIARFRYVKPNLHMNLPHMSNRDYRFIKHISDTYKYELDNLLVSEFETTLDIGKLFTLKFNTLHKIMLREFLQETENTKDNYNKGIKGFDDTEKVLGVVFNNSQIDISEVATKLHIHCMMERILIATDVECITSFVSCKNIISVGDTPFGLITQKKLDDILNFIDISAKLGLEFKTQAPIKEVIGKILGRKVNNNIKQLINYYSDVLNIKITSRKSNGSDIYKFLYVTDDESCYLDLKTQLVSPLMEIIDIDVDYEFEQGDDPTLDYYYKYDLKNNINIEGILLELCDINNVDYL